MVALDHDLQNMQEGHEDLLRGRAIKRLPLASVNRPLLSSRRKASLACLDITSATSALLRLQTRYTSLCSCCSRTKALSWITHPIAVDIVDLRLLLCSETEISKLQHCRTLSNSCLIYPAYRKRTISMQDSSFDGRDKIDPGSNLYQIPLRPATLSVSHCCSIHACFPARFPQRSTQLQRQRTGVSTAFRASYVGHAALAVSSYLPCCAGTEIYCFAHCILLRSTTPSFSSEYSFRPLCVCSFALRPSFMLSSPHANRAIYVSGTFAPR